MPVLCDAFGACVLTYRRRGVAWTWRAQRASQPVRMWIAVMAAPDIAHGVHPVRVFAYAKAGQGCCQTGG
ncbi:hypothetical protein DEH69_24395 [Streptomyces sp. PT12]|nr:hypothetical protein DEH69_24395 [Streptomyces sp. PT12]